MQEVIFIQLIYLYIYTAGGVDGMEKKACGLGDVEGEVIFLEGENIGMGEEGQGGYFVLDFTFFSGDVLVKEKAI